MPNLTRIPLIAVTAFVAVTALGGGLTLALSSIFIGIRGDFLPPASYLDGSPFASYLIPGLALLILVSAPHFVAMTAVIGRWDWAPLTVAFGGFACVIWIFVQMIFIPFSWLQALYFTTGLIELGLVLVVLGVLDPLFGRRRRHTQARPASTQRLAA